MKPCPDLREVKKCARPKVEAGYRWGILSVVEPTQERKNGYTVWRCRCECGEEILLDTRRIQRGAIRDCGCNSFVKPGMLDLTGMRFGKLTCLEAAPQRDRNGRTQWICMCDCGKLCQALTKQLRNGSKKSCGCLSHPSLKEYVGKRFGRLVVTEYAGKTKGKHRWKCKCDCGKETIVGQTELQRGITKSCGCLVSDQLRENLRLVDGTSITFLMKNRDRKPIQSNASGYNGVYWSKRLGKWAAQISFKKKTYYLGAYSELKDAVEARRRAEEVYDHFIEWYFNGMGNSGEFKPV